MKAVSPINSRSGKWYGAGDKLSNDKLLFRAVLLNICDSMERYIIILADLEANRLKLLRVG